MGEHVQAGNQTYDGFFRYKVSPHLSHNLAVCMLRAASIETRPEKFEDWLTKEKKTELRELPMFKEPDAGARFLESLVGNSRTNKFQDLVNFLESEKRKLKGKTRQSPNLDQPPYCYLGRLPTQHEIDAVQRILCSLYRSRYQSYWEKIFPLLEDRCSQLEKTLQDVNPADRLLRFLRLPAKRIRQDRIVQIFALDRGGPAFAEEAGIFIPIDPYESEIPVHGIS